MLPPTGMELIRQGVMQGHPPGSVGGGGGGGGGGRGGGSGPQYLKGTRLPLGLMKKPSAMGQESETMHQDP